MTRMRLGKKLPPAFSLDLDVPIGPGILAVSGPSQAGKTLLLEMIAGFVTPDSGRILLDDSILYDAQTRFFAPPGRRSCGYVAQRDTLFPHMTVRQNLAFAAQSIAKIERHRRIADLLERFALAAGAETLPRNLSPDQSRSATVARALVGRPKLLLLDDRGWTESEIRTIREAAPAPILLVTPNLDLCCAVASELLLLEAGRVVQRGAPAVVANRPESVEAARLLGFSNLFSGAISALDPGRNTSRIEFESFALNAAYIPGHFRGDRITVAIHPGDVRAHSGDLASGPNFVAASLTRVSMQVRTVRLEFSGGLVADLPHAEYARQKENKSWQLEFPPESLRVL